MYVNEEESYKSPHTEADLWGLCQSQFFHTRDLWLCAADIIHKEVAFSEQKWMPFLLR